MNCKQSQVVLLEMETVLNNWPLSYGDEKEPCLTPNHMLTDKHWNYVIQSQTVMCQKYCYLVKLTISLLESLEKRIFSQSMWTPENQAPKQTPADSQCIRHRHNTRRKNVTIYMENVNYWRIYQMKGCQYSRRNRYSPENKILIKIPVYRL